MERIDLERFGHVEVPEGCQFLIGVTDEEETALGIRGNREMLLDVIAKFLMSILINLDSVNQATSLASVICFLKAHRVLADSVDMAVSFDGHVLPVDQVVSDVCKEIKKDS